MPFPQFRPFLRHLLQTRTAAATALALILAAAQLAGAADCSNNKNVKVTPNYKDADLGQIVEAVSELTCKNFIIDPRVRAQVTLISATPMNPQEFYEAFLAVLQVNAFVAVQSGKVYKIIPDSNARQLPANDLPDRVSGTSDEIVTQIVAIKNVSATQLVPILRPLIPQSGHLAAYPQSNMLIISDHANNVSRILRIIGRIDQGTDQEVEIIPLEHASASEVVRVVNALTASAAEGGGGPSIRLVADDRTNSILIGGEKSQRLRLRALVAHLDTPLEAGGDTQVRYMRYADAEKIATKLKEQIGAVVAQTTPGQGAAAQSAAGANADRSITLWADPETNALVITAPPKAMKSLMLIIDKLDIRRAQVQIESIIVDMSVDHAADIGVNWVIDGSNGNNIVGGFVSPVGGVSIVDLARAINDPSTVTTVPGGTTIGVGRMKDTGVNFAAILRALRSDTNTNIISTPNIVTMDNQEAEIKVAQEVPFVTGSFTNTGGAGGAVNPFQTIQREEVGLILKVTPQINNEGDTVMLKIEQEASNIAQTTGEGDLTAITNKRTITTNVLIQDGGIIALGGLMSDQVTSGTSRVPFLGKIPILGQLFKTTNGKKAKTNLMVFIRPTILRDDVQSAVMTESKYRVIRDAQQKMDNGKVPLLSSEKQPLLAPFEDVQKQTPHVVPDSERPAAPLTQPAGAATPQQPAATSPPAPVPQATSPQSAPPAPAPAPPTREELLRQTRPDNSGTTPPSN
ncbi:MAG TPA: type II secretion system secretin GspD [Steroidobacteraceae bacterium]|nr:type II secretion system secretin GspD [Steroidobacteraceae bacterium]